MESSYTLGGSPPKRKIIINKWAIILILVSFLLLFIASVFWIRNNSAENSKKLPENIRKQINSFQPYYFSNQDKLVNSYKVDPDTIKYEQGTLIFNLRSPSEGTISISQQPIPADFSGQGGSFVGKDSFDTANGKVTLSYVDSRTSAFLITNDNKTLIILNTTSPVSKDTIRVILSSLEKA